MDSSRPRILAPSDEETVGKIDGIGPERGVTILAAARAHVDQKRAEEAALAAAGEGAASEPGLETAPGAAPVSEERRE
jgi:hypothetical protein